jgi:cyanate lyase
MLRPEIKVQREALVDEAAARCFALLNLDYTEVSELRASGVKGQTIAALYPLEMTQIAPVFQARLTNAKQVEAFVKEMELFKGSTLNAITSGLDDLQYDQMLHAHTELEGHLDFESLVDMLAKTRNEYPDEARSALNDALIDMVCALWLGFYWRQVSQLSGWDEALISLLAIVESALKKAETRAAEA